MVRDIRNRNEADVAILAIERPPGKRLIDVLESVATNDIGIGESGSEIVGISRAALILRSNIVEAGPEEAAIGATELEFPDDYGLTQIVKAFLAGDLPIVDIEADDVAIARAGLNNFRNSHLEAAAEVLCSITPAKPLWAVRRV